MEKKKKRLYPLLISTVNKDQKDKLEFRDFTAIFTAIKIFKILGAPGWLSQWSIQLLISRLRV